MNIPRVCGIPRCLFNGIWYPLNRDDLGFWKSSLQGKAKNTASIGFKKTKDEKAASAGYVISNGSLASQQHTKQAFSLGVKSKSFNERKTADNNLKPAVACINVSHAKVNVQIIKVVVYKYSLEQNSLFSLSVKCASVSVAHYYYYVFHLAAIWPT